MHEDAPDIGPEEDEQPCDFDRTDAEEARLLTWAAAQTKLTEKMVEDQIAISRANLQGVGSVNLKSFVRANRWKLLKMMAFRELATDSLDEILEPTDDALAHIEGKKTRKNTKKEKAKKDTLPKPDHVEQIGEEKIAVFKPVTPESTHEPDDADEEAHPLYKQIPKGMRRKIKQWMNEQSHTVSGYDARVIAGLAVAELDKDACRFAAENDAVFLAYVQRRMEKQRLKEPDQDSTILPPVLERKIGGVELTEQERRALVFFAAVQTISSADMKQKVKPEAVCVASGDQNYDTFECPLCIRSLETKLKGLGITFDIKSTFGKKERLGGAQGYRINWIKMKWNEERSYE